MSRKAQVLVVDDKKNMLAMLKKVLSHDFRVFCAEDVAGANTLIDSERFDVVLCDLKLRHESGIEVLKQVKAIQPHAKFVLMTAYGTINSAVEALKLGAADYITKPFVPEQLVELLTRHSGPSLASEPLPKMIGQSQAMLDVSRMVRKLAPSDASLVILGETGTGKEVVARAVHEISGRQGPFVGLNCAAIPQELMERELFGHVKGAFTDARNDSVGLFMQANGGTLFLDEVGDLPLSLQAKLTRVLQERTVRPLGGSKEEAFDVRFLCATHRNLKQLVEQGRFREDLWYRLNVGVVQLPPLRKRAGDARLLALRFFAEMKTRYRSDSPGSISEQALLLIDEHDWPGNVRQLRAAIERAYLIADGDVLEAGDLPVEIVGIGNTSPLGSWSEWQASSRIEWGRRYLDRLLRRYHGQVPEASEHAQVERESFYRLLRKHKIDPDNYRV